MSLEGEMEAIERRWRAVAAAILAFVALGVAVMLLLLPLGATYDNDCGTLLQQSTCEDRAGNRVVMIVVAATIAAVFCGVAVKWSVRRRRTVAAAAVIVAVVVALVLVGAPYANDWSDTAGRSFNVHCPGVFSDLGGDEHPPAGADSVCNRSVRHRGFLAGGTLVVAALGCAVTTRGGGRSPKQRPLVAA